MTAQAMDLCRFRGDEWAIAAIDGAWPVPTSRSLGFATCGPSTANYRGRVDELSVDEDGLLRLVAIEAYVTRRTRHVTPPGARREPLERGTDENGGVRFLFDDLRIPFTGTLTLGRDLNRDLYVHMGTQRANRFERRAVLRFQDGELVSASFEDGSSPDPPPTFGQTVRFWSGCLLGVGVAGMVAYGVFRALGAIFG